MAIASTIIACLAAKIKKVTITSSAAPSKNGANKNHNPPAAPAIEPFKANPPAIAPAPPASTQVVTLVQLMLPADSEPGNTISRTFSNN